MATLDDLKNNQDFLRLDPESKRQVLSVQNPDFSQLSPDDQKSVISTQFPGQIVQDHPVARIASKVYTPLIEGAAMATGAAAGAPAGPEAAIPLSVSMFPVGKQAAQALDRRLGVPTENAPTTMSEAIPREAKDLGEGAMIEAGGKAATAVASPVADAMAEPFMTTYYNEIKALADKFKIPMTAAARAGTAGLARIESAVSKIPFAQGILKAANDRMRDAIDKNVVQKLVSQGTSSEDANAVGARILNKITGQGMEAEAAPTVERSGILGNATILPKEQAGGILQKDLAQQSVSHAQNVVKPAYDAVSRAAGDYQGPAPALGAAAQSALQEIGNAKTFDQGLVGKLKALSGMQESGPTGPVNVGGRTFQPGDEAYPRMYELVHGPQEGAVPPAYSYSALKNELDSLKSLASGQNAAPGAGAAFQSSPEGRIYSKLAEAASEDLNKFGGKDLQPLRDQATAAAKQGYEKFGNDHVRGILNANPEDAMDLAIKPGNVTDTRNIMQSVSPDTQAAIKGHVLDTLMQNPQNELFSREDLAKNMASYGDTLKEVFSPQELSQLQQTAAARSNIPIESPFFRRYLLDSAQANPSRVIGFLTSKGTTPDAINKIRGVIGEDTFGDFQDQALLRLGQNPTGQFDPIKFYKGVEKVGIPTYNAMMAGDKEETADALYKLSRAYGTVEREAGNPSGTAQAYGIYRLLLESFHNPVRAAKDLSLGTGMALGHLLPFEDFVASPTRFIAGTLPGAASKTTRAALMEKYKTEDTPR